MINHKPQNCRIEPVIPRIRNYLVRFYFLFGAALAAVYGNQFSGANSKLLTLPDLPLVVAIATERFTLGQLVSTWAFELKDIGHDIAPCGAIQFLKSCHSKPVKSA